MNDFLPSSQNSPSPRSHKSRSRRKFLQDSAVATAALGTLAIPSSVHADSGEVLKVGLIGSGGRGTGAAIDALHATPKPD